MLYSILCWSVCQALEQRGLWERPVWDADEEGKDCPEIYQSATDEVWRVHSQTGPWLHAREGRAKGRVAKDRKNYEKQADR